MSELTLHLPSELSKKLKMVADIEAKDPESLALNVLENYVEADLDELNLMRTNIHLKEVFDELESNLSKDEINAWLTAFEKA
jgi:predicted transcriptional regulator